MYLGMYDADIRIHRKCGFKYVKSTQMQIQLRIRTWILKIRMFLKPRYGYSHTDDIRYMDIRIWMRIRM